MSSASAYHDYSAYHEYTGNVTVLHYSHTNCLNSEIEMLLRPRSRVANPNGVARCSISAYYDLSSTITVHPQGCVYSAQKFKLADIQVRQTIACGILSALRAC